MANSVPPHPPVNIVLCVLWRVMVDTLLATPAQILIVRERSALNFTHSLTRSLAPQHRAHSDKVTVILLVKKFPASLFIMLTRFQLNCANIGTDDTLRAYLSIHKSYRKDKRLERKRKAVYIFAAV